MDEKMGTRLHINDRVKTQTGAGNGETLETYDNGRGFGVVLYDCGGASRTGVILEAGRVDGQRVFVTNISDAAETITFATAATSNVANGTAMIVARYESVPFIWSETLGKWQAALGGGTTLADNTVTTATIVDENVTSAKIDPTVIQAVTVDITATEIVGTAAGDIGHSAGAVLVAAPGAGYIHEFISATLSYTFATAAYTGGNNDLVIRQGTTAVSAAIADADLIGDSASDIAYVGSLAAADIKLTANSTLNLAGTAYTQPGTAAGTLKVHVLYRTVAA